MFTMKNFRPWNEEEKNVYKKVLEREGNKLVDGYDCEDCLVFYVRSGPFTICLIHGNEVGFGVGVTKKNRRENRTRAERLAFHRAVTWEMEFETNMDLQDSVDKYMYDLLNSLGIKYVAVG